MSDTTLPVAIVAAAGFVERTLTDTQKALIAAGLRFHVISPDGGLVQGWHEDAWGHHFMADEKLSDVLSADYCGLILPNGAHCADTMTENPHAKRLTKAFLDGDKPVLAIGDAIRLLIAGEIVAGRRVAAPEHLRSELVRAGAEVVEGEAVVSDGALITALGENDAAKRIEAFLAQLTSGSVPQAA